MRVIRRVGGGVVVGVVSVSLGVASTARADEPVAAREPTLMTETAEVTSVVDAFDKDDPFDLNLLVGFDQQWKNAKIRRESPLFQPGLSTGGFVAANENIAAYKSSLSRLLLGADVGIYHDFAFVFRAPLILNWSQSLGDLDGSAALAPQLLQDPASSSGQQLFSVPFTSPNRSGLDYLSFGLDWAIFNQQRDETKPTWVVGVEGRVPVGTPLHACNATAGYTGPQCPDPTDQKLTKGSRDPGISRGMYSILAKMVWSRRFGYVEPYSGFWFQADFPNSDSDFGKWNPSSNLEGAPPLQGSFGLGLETIPFENREAYQRVSGDLRFMGTYHSPGREYSELFDALGSSGAPSLRTPNPTAYKAMGSTSVVDTSSAASYFTGITEQQAFGSFTASASVTMQPGKYIKFQIGGGLTYVQSHLISAADTCNPNLNNITPAQAGPCINQRTGAVQGVPNPDHHDVIDLPGHRFSVDDTTVIDLFGTIIVMF
jgi:hypothetical protein